MGTLAIEVKNVSKSFGRKTVLRNVSFEVPEHTIFGMIGPNGAGKSTTLDIIAGFKHADQGTVEILGEEVRRDSASGKVGLMLQDTALYSYLTVEETLQFFAKLYPHPLNVQEVLTMLHLEEALHTQVRRLSGGQKRKLDFGVAVIGAPPIVILDEPTTGFDPTSKRDTWNAIKGLRNYGTTVLLTTQMMDEAEYLCDHVAVLINGSLNVTGTVGDVKKQFNSMSLVRMTLSQSAPAAGHWQAIRTEVSGNVITFETLEPAVLISEVTKELQEQGIGVEDMDVSSASLEEVLIQLTANNQGGGRD